MKIEHFIKLSPGDVVRHKMTGNAYTVIACHGDEALLMRTQYLTNPSEWDLIAKGCQELVPVDEEEIDDGNM